MPTGQASTSCIGLVAVDDDAADDDVQDGPVRELERPGEEEEDAAAPPEAEEAGLGVEGGLDADYPGGEELGPLQDADEQAEEANVGRHHDVDDVGIPHAPEGVDDGGGDHGDAS